MNLKGLIVNGNGVGYDKDAILSNGRLAISRSSKCKLLQLKGEKQRSPAEWQAPVLVPVAGERKSYLSAPAGLMICTLR